MEEHNHVPDDLEVVIERLKQVEKRIDERLNSDKDAFDEFKDALDQRLEQMNELRTQILTERSLFVTWWTLISVVGAGVTLAIAVATLVVKLLFHS